MKHARSDYDERIQDLAGLIPDDEPVLLIRGQDVCALPAIDAWIKAACEIDGIDEALIESVKRHEARIRVWQETRAVKTPDAPGAVLADTPGGDE